VALAVNAMLFWLLYHLALRKEAKKCNIVLFTRDCLVEWPVILKFSLPVTISGLLVAPVLWGCNVLLVNQPNGYAQMGLYDAANQLQQVLLFIPGAVSQIVLPLLSNVTGQNDHVRFKKVLKYNIWLNVCATCLVALPVAVMAPYFMSAYGDKFKEGAAALSILSVSTILISLNNVIGQAMASKDQMWVGLTFNVIWAIAVLSLSWVFIRGGFGVTGLALANLGAYLLHSVLQLVYLQKVLKNEVQSTAAKIQANAL
jgi:O-antigen/teichoic acid export membrane protein